MLQRCKHIYPLALIGACWLLCARTDAQSVEPAPAPEESAPLPKESSASPKSAAPGESNAQAVPESAASMEAAAASKQAAEPHPIVASPADPRRPAFQLYVEIDLPVLGIGAVFASSRLVLSQKAYCAPLCDPKDLNRLDRKTAGYWSPGWQLTSNIAIYSLAAASAVFLAIDEGFMNALNDGVVIAESALAAMATASIMTLAASRPRPFLYGEKAPEGDRNGSDAGLSFLSSHAAVAFALATATVMTARRLHPRNVKVPVIVATLGGVLAALVAVARVFSGMHFITDAAGGAIVGTSMGVLIPALHESGTQVAPQNSAHSRGLSLIRRF